MTKKETEQRISAGQELRDTIINGITSLDPMTAICVISDAMGLRPRKGQENNYEGIFAQGDFQLMDYNTGLLTCHLWLTKHETQDLWSVRLYVGNMDDGDWAANSNYLPKDEAISVLNNVKAEWDRTIHIKLPSCEDMNKFLEPFGMWGDFGN